MRWVRESDPVVVRSSSPNIAQEPTAYSFGFAYAFGGSSPWAFGFPDRGRAMYRA